MYLKLSKMKFSFSVSLILAFFAPDIHCSELDGSTLESFVFHIRYFSGYTNAALASPQLYSITTLRLADDPGIVCLKTGEIGLTCQNSVNS